MDFRESEDRSRCEFPSDLTNTERKFLHQLALQLGLKSKSTGKEPNRYIVVTKRDESVQQRRKDEVLHGDDHDRVLQKPDQRHERQRKRAIQKAGKPLAECILIFFLVFLA